MIDSDRRQAINGIQAERWLSNEPKLYANLIRQAAEQTGYSVYTGAPSTPDYDDVARIGVYTCEPQRDHGPFWAEYHRLKLEMEHTDE